MAGASRQHNLITGNVFRELGAQLRRGTDCGFRIGTKKDVYEKQT